MAFRPTRGAQLFGGALEASARGSRPYLILTLLCLILYLPGLAQIPPLDRDEARFAQATAQMLETGDFVDIRFQDTPRHKKPAGIHWLQAASVSLLSGPEAREIWAYRVPSAIAAWLAVLLTFSIGARLFDRQTGLVGAGLLGCSVMLTLEAHQAKTDAALLAATALAIWALARFYDGAQVKRTEAQAPSRALTGPATASAFWIAQGLGILLKGPITPLVSLLTIAALSAGDRNIRWLKGLRPAWGIPLMLVIAAPWFIAVQQATGGEFASTAISTDLIPKLLGGQESHGAPPGYFTALMIVFFWPGALFAWPALYRAWKVRTRNHGVRFCLFWLLPAWVLFEAVPTKLPHYVLPLYPALALLTAWAILGIARGAARPVQGWRMAPFALLWLVPGLALSAAALAVPLSLGDDVPVLGAAPLIVGLATLGVVLLCLCRDDQEWGALGGTVLGGLLVMTFLSLAFPRVDAMWISRNAASLVDAHLGEAHGPLAAAGFSEPSLVFLLGTGTKLTDGLGAAAHLMAAGRAALVEERQLTAFTEALGPKGDQIKKAGSVQGINYSKGKRTTLHLFINEDPNAIQLQKKLNK